MATHVPPLKSLSIGLMMACTVCFPSQARSQQCPNPTWQEGCWTAPFDHPNTPATTVDIDGAPVTNSCVPSWDLSTPTNLMAIHMSLIPKGSRRGHVIVWGEPYAESGINPPPSTRQIQWSIIDPANPTAADNFCANLPAGLGDLFCAGHAWTANGDLLVVGGTDCHDYATGCGGGWTGSKLAYLWQPPDFDPLTTDPGGTWLKQDDLDLARWYPSVIALGESPIVGMAPKGEDRMMVAGGTNPGNATAVNSYQIWRPGQVGPGSSDWEANPLSSDNTFPGPTTGMELENYPRGVLLSSNGSTNADQRARVAFAGFQRQSDRISHYDLPGGQPSAWQEDGGWIMDEYREYGSAVLLPIFVGTTSKDMILALGGLSSIPVPPPVMNQNQILGSIQISRANQPTGSPPGGRYWINDNIEGQAVSLLQPRWIFNTVLLPDSRLFIVGGETSWGGFEGCTLVPSKTPEIYDKSQNDPLLRIRAAADHQIIRDYHSTALLLPTGEVLCGGGEFRHKVPCGSCPCGNPDEIYPADYEIYRPDYISSSTSPTFTRPVIEPPSLPYPIPANWKGDITLEYGQVENVFYTAEGDVIIDRVVLMRPGSVTHHADTNQRCVNLNFERDVEPGTNRTFVRVAVPSLESNLLPRGIYMMFLVTSQTVTTQGVPSEAVWVEVK